MQITKKKRGNVALYVKIIILEAFSIFLAYSKFISIAASSFDSGSTLLAPSFTGSISFGFGLPNLESNKDDLVKYNTKQYSTNVENIPI